MAITYIAWRGCPLQTYFGEVGFHEMWMITVDRNNQSYPEEGRAASSDANGSEVMHMNKHFHLKSGEVLTQRELNQQLVKFGEGHEECASCETNLRGVKLGCCALVETPLDQKIEVMLGEYFLAEMKKKDSVAYKFYDKMISQTDPKTTPFNLARSRGYAIDLTTLHEPVSIKFGSLFSKHRFDTGQALSAIFATVPRGLTMNIYRGFLTHLGGAVNSKHRETVRGSKSCQQLAEYARHFGLASRTHAFQKWMVDITGE